MLLLFCSAVQAQTSMEAKQLLDRVAKKMKTYDNLSFDFTYALVNQKENIRQETKGVITVAGENYRLEIPEAIQILDGQQRYTIVPENEEVTISGADSEDEMVINPTELLFFYQEGYDYHMDIQQNVSGRQIQYVKLIPANQEEQMAYLLLGIDRSNLSIYRLIEIGTNGTQTTLNVKNFSTNQTLASNLFTFDAADYPDYYINN
ncbi:MAG: LolA family protein [Flavobacteriaceae bacterium]